MSDEQIGEKLVRMESLVTHLERQYDELNKVVLEQGKALAKLTKWPGVFRKCNVE